MRPIKKLARAFVALLAFTLLPCTFAEPASKLIDGRYRVQKGGATINDTRTGLVWMRCSVGQTWSGAACEGRAEKLSLPDAMQRAADLNSAWRIPTSKELAGLRMCLHDAEVGEQVGCPAWSARTKKLGLAFPNRPDDRAYWTASTGVDGSPESILFDLMGPLYGFSDAGDRLYVLLVRDPPYKPKTLSCRFYS
jgi:hypothetical protein